MMVQLQRIDDILETDQIVDRELKSLSGKDTSSQALRYRHFPYHLKRRISEYKITIDVLLKRLREQEMDLNKMAGDHITMNVLPYLVQLRETRINSNQRALIDIIFANLQEMIGPAMHKTTTRYFGFTPMETRVADLVKQGNRSKEIAAVLNCSLKTIDHHRTSIRRKLGIKNQRINLSTYLMSV